MSTKKGTCACFAAPVYQEHFRSAIPTGSQIPVWDWCSKIHTKLTLCQNNFAQPTKQFYPQPNIPAPPPDPHPSHASNSSGKKDAGKRNRYHTCAWKTDEPRMEKTYKEPDHMRCQHNRRQRINMGV